jgi:hypothetical protein
MPRRRAIRDLTCLLWPRLRDKSDHLLKEPYSARMPPGTRRWATGRVGTTTLEANIRVTPRPSWLQSPGSSLPRNRYCNKGLSSGWLLVKLGL